MSRLYLTPLALDCLDGAVDWSIGHHAPKSSARYIAGMFEDIAAIAAHSKAGRIWSATRRGHVLRVQPVGKRHGIYTMLTPDSHGVERIALVHLPGFGQDVDHILKQLSTQIDAELDWLQSRLGDPNWRPGRYEFR